MFRLRLVGCKVPEMLRHQHHLLAHHLEIRKRRSSRNLLSKNDKKRSETSMSSKKVEQILSKQSISITGRYFAGDKSYNNNLLKSGSFNYYLIQIK